MVPYAPLDNKSALVRVMLWRLNRYQTIMWTDIDQMTIVTESFNRLLVATTHLEMQRPQTVNSGSELHGNLTTWEGTRIVAPVTSWHLSPYSDVIMSAMAYYIASLTIIHSTVYSGADKSPTSLAFVREFTGDRWIPLTKGQ